MPPSAPGRAFRQGLARLGLGALDALLPPHCLSCEAPVARQGTQCADCFRQLNRITAPFCAHCGVPFLHAGQAGPGGLCPNCLARPPAFAVARAALRYDEGAQRLILPFKHADRTELAPALGAMMAQSGAALLARADLLAPVPLHWRRLLRRRYNQAALLASRLAAISGKPSIPDLLRRSRATPALGDRGAAERAMLREGQLLFAYLHLAPDPEQTKGLLASKCAAIAYETVTDRNGGLPLLAPMSEVASRIAVFSAAETLLKHKLEHPPLTLLFTVREESGLHGARELKPADLDS